MKKTGDWLDTYGKVNSDKLLIEHKTAAEDLNYLIHAGILEVDGTFNPDAPVKKEEALKIQLRSLAYMYYSACFDASTALSKQELAKWGIVRWG